jgi:hypothetical protein
VVLRLSSDAAQPDDIVRAFSGCCRAQLAKQSCSTCPAPACRYRLRTHCHHDDQEPETRPKTTHLLSATRARLRMPAVSISVSCCPPGSVTVVSTASRVVPLMSHTMARSSPQMAFSRLLLPAAEAAAVVQQMVGVKWLRHGS